MRSPTIGFTAADVTPPATRASRRGSSAPPCTHPDYSDFTDLKNWNDTGVIILDEAPGLPTAPLAPANYLDQFAPAAAQQHASSSPSATAPRCARPSRDRRRRPRSASRSSAATRPRSARSSPTRSSRPTATSTTRAPAAAPASATPAVRAILRRLRRRRHELRLHEQLPVPRRLPARRHPDRARLDPRLHRRPGLPDEGDIATCRRRELNAGFPTHFVVRNGHRRFSRASRRGPPGAPGSPRIRSGS